MKHLALVGPTASGKTELSIEVALALGGVEIVSADALMVYRGADIGTAKPTPGARGGVAHHCIDLFDPSVDASLSHWLGAARAAIEAIEQREHRALLVGGTGLYVQALVDAFAVPGSFPQMRRELEASTEPTEALHRRLAEMDPLAATRMEPTNRRRIIRALEVCLGSGQPFSSYGPGVENYPENPRWSVVGLWPPKSWLDDRIERRVDAMLAAGLVDEVRALASTEGGLSRTCRQALGYKELLSHIEEGTALEACRLDVINHTRRFARRQRSWFGRDPRIRWVAGGPGPGRQKQALLAHWRRETG